MAPDLIESAADGVKTTRSGVERGGCVSEEGWGGGGMPRRPLDQQGRHPREDPVTSSARAD